MAAAAMLEVAREVAEDVTEAVVGEEELRRELGSLRGDLLRLRRRLAVEAGGPSSFCGTTGGVGNRRRRRRKGGSRVGA